MVTPVREVVRAPAGRPDPAEWFAMLAKNSLLLGMSEGALARVRQAVQWLDCEPGHRVFERGQTSTEVHFVVWGSLRVVSQSASGREVAFAELPDRRRPGEECGDGVRIGVVEAGAIDGEERVDVGSGVAHSASSSS